LSGNDENPIVADLKEDLTYVESELKEAQRQIKELESKVYNLEDENFRLRETIDNIEYTIRRATR
jgi:peptidoglycan hydrolase CwlO-like protein